MRCLCDVGSAHPVAIILVGESAEEFKRAVLVQHADGGMSDAVEHRGFHGRVVYHVLEDERLANQKFVVKIPSTHEVAGEAGVAADAIEG